MLRIFIAINFDDETKRVLGEFQARLIASNPDPAIRWVEPDIFHLTLHFLPCENQERVEAVKKILAQLVPPVGAFDLKIGEPGAFPNEFQPRVIKLAMEPSNQNLAQLRLVLGESLAKEGFEIDRRLWEPHLTLARVNYRRLSLRNFRRLNLRLSLEPPALEWRVTKIDLMQSELFEEGPKYQILSSYELRGTL